MVAELGRLDESVAIVARVVGVDPVVDRPVRSVIAPSTDGVAHLGAVANALAGAGIAVEDLGLRQPTLDEVFLTLTGTATEPALETPLEVAR